MLERTVVDVPKITNITVVYTSRTAVKKGFTVVVHLRLRGRWLGRHVHVEFEGVALNDSPKHFVEKRRSLNFRYVSLGGWWKNQQQELQQYIIGRNFSC